MTISWRFDRGTLLVQGDAASGWPGVVWDPRTQNLRAAAHRYRALRRAATTSGVSFTDPIPARWSRSRQWAPPSLRPYQRDAVMAWLGQGKRGVIVLPTGAGKTRVALAAAAAVRGPTAVLCPTRVLLGQWLEALKQVYAGPLGVLGDGESRIEPVTVMTFESAFRRMDALGDRFALLVVDEVHHFASGLRAEALEACVAPYRLGLTATAPEAASAGELTLDDLVGPVAFAMSIGDLSGTHLAAFDVVRLRVGLTAAERAEYVRMARPYLELQAALRRATPSIDWEGTMRAMASTADGRRAIRAWQGAVALAAFPEEKRRLAAALIERHRDDKTLVFASRASDARTVSSDSLVPAITAEIVREERDAVMARFRDGTLRCVVSARVLNEGVDVPDANVAVLLGGALGVREQAQRVGRVLRPGPGKRAIVYDIATAGTVDADRADRKWRRFAAQTLPAMPG